MIERWLLKGDRVRVRRLPDASGVLFDMGVVTYADRCEVTAKLDNGTHVTLRRTSERWEYDDGKANP